MWIRPSRHWLAAAGLLAVLVAPCGGQVTTVSEEAHNQFVLAYRLLQRGQDREAAAAFDEYLGHFPKDEKRGDALFYRALLEMRAGRRRTALGFLANSPAPQIVPDHAVQLLSGQLHVDTGRYKEAVAALEPVVVDGLDPVTAASALHLRGAAYRGAGNLPAAAAQLEAASRIDSPLRARAQLDHARVLMELNQNAAALKTVQQCLVTKDPAVTPGAARLGGDLAYKMDRYEQAVAMYDIVLRGFQSTPHFGPAVRGAMWSRFSAKQYGQVIHLHEQHLSSLKRPEDRIEIGYLAASAQQELGRHEAAVATFQSILVDAATWKTLDRLLYKLAVSRFELGRFDAMAAALRQLESRRPKSPLRADGAFLLAAADAKQGKTDRAADRLTAIINLGADHSYYGQALLQRAALHESAGRLQHAVADYAAFLTSGLSLTSTRRPEVALRLIDLHYRLGQHELSRSVARKLLGLDAKQPARLSPEIEGESLYRLSLALIKLKRYDEALAALRRLLEHHPQNAYRDEARYYRALVLITLDRPGQALADLNAVVATKLDPELRRNAMRLTALHLRRANRDEEAARALEHLEAMIGLAELTGEERLWLGRYLSRRGEHRRALACLESLAAQAMPRRDRAELMFLTGLGRRAVGEHGAAVEAFDEAVALGGGFDVRARLELGHTLFNEGRWVEALDAYAGLINAKPTRVAVEALLARARVYRKLAQERRRQRDVDGAAGALRKAKSALDRVVLLHSYPELAPLPHLAHVELHDVLIAQGAPTVSPQDITANLQELIDKFPQSPHADYARAMQAATSQHRGEAVRLLKRLRTQPLDPELQRHVETRLEALSSEP